MVMCDVEKLCLQEMATPNDTQLDQFYQVVWADLMGIGGLFVPIGKLPLHQLRKGLLEHENNHDVVSAIASTVIAD